MSFEPLQLIKDKMQELNLAALIIPTNDPHFSEYPPAHWSIREWASGFTGSAGTLVVTRDKAGLWTDSRYFIQAERELEGSGIDLHRVTDRSSPGITEWLSKVIENGQTVAALRKLTSLSQFQKYDKAFTSKNIKLKLIDDFFSEIWLERPALPKDTIFEHELIYTGLSRQDKIKAIREVMQENNCSYHLVTTLDDIAWILNLRSTDVSCNPVFISYLLIAKETCFLFTKEEKTPAQLMQKLITENIFIYEYSHVFQKLAALPEGTHILLDNAFVNMEIQECLEGKTRVSKALPSIDMKAIKSDTEIHNFRKCMVKDGVALTYAFKWLEDNLEKQSVSEYAFAERIAHQRSQMENYFGESFNAIVGYNANGAIVHYRADKKNAANISKKGILLTDCGGQYKDGTTDITRTISMDGQPTAGQKTAYTAVLKGHIALACARFPEGTTGVQLDSFARMHLWKQGLNFSHGTGHGVGFFNSVHELPQSIGPLCKSKASLVFKEGMITSNEPGYYEENRFGIRIENLILCKKSHLPGFLEFETITLFPIDKDLIEMEALTISEKKWLNAYHERVFNELSDKLDEEHRIWLAHKCKRIEE
jgi:Xaa-Pro aminopeptidase